MPSNTPPTTDLEAQVAKKVQKTMKRAGRAVNAVGKATKPSAWDGARRIVDTTMSNAKPMVAKPGMSRRNRGPL